MCWKEKQKQKIVPYYTGEENEAQNGQELCPGSLSYARVHAQRAGLLTIL